MAGPPAKNLFSGAGKAPERIDFCREGGPFKPQRWAAHSWDDEPRCTLKITGALRRSGGQRGGAAYNRSGARTQYWAGPRRSPRLGPVFAGRCRFTGDRPKGGFWECRLAGRPSPYKIGEAAVTWQGIVRRGSPARPARTADPVRPGPAPRTRARIRARKSFSEIGARSSPLVYERGRCFVPLIRPPGYRWSSWHH